MQFSSGASPFSRSCRRSATMTSAAARPAALKERSRRRASSSRSMPSFASSPRTTSPKSPVSVRCQQRALTPPASGAVRSSWKLATKRIWEAGDATGGMETKRSAFVLTVPSCSPLAAEAPAESRPQDEDEGERHHDEKESLHGGFSTLHRGNAIPVGGRGGRFVLASGLPGAG